MSSTVAVNTNGHLGLTGLLTILFVTLKLTGVIAWSWVWVLAPVWIVAAAVAVLLLVVLVIALIATK